MDAHERSDDLVDSGDAPRRPTPHANWVRVVALGVIVLFVLATIASFLS